MPRRRFITVAIPATQPPRSIGRPSNKVPECCATLGFAIERLRGNADLGVCGTALMLPTPNTT